MIDWGGVMHNTRNNGGGSGGQAGPRRQGTEQAQVGSDPSALPAGTKVGAYIIEEVLGSGGFGITYRARHATLNKQFAWRPFGSARCSDGAARLLPRAHPARLLSSSRWPCPIGPTPWVTTSPSVSGRTRIATSWSTP